MIKYQKNAYEIANILRYFTYDVNCRYPDTYSIFHLAYDPNKTIYLWSQWLPGIKPKKNPHWKTQRKKKETQRSHSVWGCWQIVWQFVCAIMFINSACCCLSLASGIKDQAPSPRISVLRKTCETKTQDIPSTITHTHTHTHIAAQKSWILSLVSRLSQVMSATQICGGVGGLGGLVEWGNVAWPLTRCQLKC